jgi:rod shape-determining protein MreD
LEDNASVRRHVIAGLVMIFLAIIETSLLPEALGPLPRPNLVLVVSSTWAAMRGDEGLIWAFFGGVMLDVMSGAPFGTYTAGLVLGNIVAMVIDRVSIPVQLLRVMNWVAVTSVVSQTVGLLVLGLLSRPFDIQIGVSTVILPSLIINAVLAIPTYAILNQVQARLRERERFLPRR